MSTQLLWIWLGFTCFPAPNFGLPDELLVRLTGTRAVVMRTARLEPEIWAQPSDEIRVLPPRSAILAI